MITNWHAILMIGLLVVVPVAGKLMGLSNDVIVMVTGLLVTLATASGFINAADQASLTKTANDLSKQVDAGISNVRQDLTDMHTVSTANVAAIHTAVAVVAAKVSAPQPAPLAAPVAIVKEASPIVVEASHEL